MKKTLRPLSVIAQLFCLGLLLSGNTFADQTAISGDAGLAGAFLTYGAGARAMGMGRAFAGLADDATAVYWNPGGLAGVPQNQILLQHAMLLDQGSYDYLGYSYMFPYIGTLGFGFAMLNQGAAEGRNSVNVVTDPFTNQQMGFLLGFGSDITATLSAGASIKVVTQAIKGISGSGVGADLGIMYHPWPMLNLGLAVQNVLAPAIKLNEDSERYPMNIVLGAALKLFGERLKLDVDLSKNADQNTLKPRFGAEYSPIRNLFVRAGLDDTEIGVGAGYRYSDFQLDYALGFQTPELMHKVSLSYLFGGYVLEIKAEPATFSPIGLNKVSVLRIRCQTKFEVKRWSVDLRNEANVVAKHYSGEGFPPDHIVWDGLLEDNKPMADGTYRMILVIEDTNGETKNAPEANVNIQSVLPLGISPLEIE